jgi:hypothetical protein
MSTMLDGVADTCPQTPTPAGNIRPIGIVDSVTAGEVTTLSAARSVDRSGDQHAQRGVRLFGPEATGRVQAPLYESCSTKERSC